MVAERPSSDPEFPFPTDADDHCESPIDAYRDIVPLFTCLGTQLYSQNRSNELSIYDPYYCNGAVVRHLAVLGFPNVYNRKEDCYVTWAASWNERDSGNNNSIIHTMDALMTNPPYSGNHIEQLIEFVTSDAMVQSQTPWFLLLPQWVHKKNYYIQTTTAHPTHPIQPFYLLPHKRYVYQPPPNFRSSRKSDVHKKSSPFVSMWYCWGGTAARNAALMQHFYASSRSKTCDLARSKNAIRDLRRQRA
jgi:hypothetical protein